ncbi:Nucleoporin nup189 [Neolecta irregularis DAH-3]|uniref:Nucleoporin nup189 n=1 Tax=Neolecta irregularis (strain DAH-3) TaxID=1198029 RepID=A0A1U7LHA3_NEOID|nr:Nucleoporin nup189 [Neolecta irregularis DAH-3]|eukprot:OLL22035.1 Nucleoporin nup189 [Neolecta irregularis DAH-3]
MPAYQKASLEELRLVDYEQGRRYGTEGGAGAFGQPTTFVDYEQGRRYGTEGGAGAFGQPTTFGAGNTNTGTTTFGGTAFGQNAPSSGGLFGNTATATPAFGASTTTNTFGNTNTGSGLFGSNTNTSQPQPGGLFGRSTAGTTGSGLFGSSSTNPPASGFGFGANTQPVQTTSTFGGFGQNTQNNQAKPAFGFGTSTTGFGSNVTNTPATSGLFGQTSSTPAFGATNTSTSSTPFSFGSNNANTNQPPSGGLFGSTTNNQQKPAFSFGSSTTGTGTGFGQNMTGGSTGGGLFGNTNTATTQPSSGLFGNMQNNTGTTGGLFGTPSSSQQPASGGLFGNMNTNTTGSGLYGNTNTNPGGGLFGQKPATGGLFGSNITTQPSTGSIFGGNNSTFGNNNAGGSSLFGNNPQPGGGLFGQPTQQPQQQQLQASIDSNPYGANPLFQSVGTGQQTPLGPIATPLKTNAHKPKPAILNQFKLTPRAAPSSRLLNLRPGCSPSPVSPMGSRNMHLFDGRNDDSTLSPDAFTPRGSIKKLIIDRKVSEADLLSGGADWSGVSQGPPRDKTAPSPRKTSFNHATEQDVRPEISKIVESESLSSKPLQGPSKHEMAQSPRYQSPDVKTQEVEGTYWTSPAMSILLDYPREALRSLKNFKVGRRGYGQVSFNKPVDLTDVAAIEYIPGKIIIFDSKLCTVYPDEEEKPLVGQGLNVPATITLEGCWPFSKEDRKPITDPENRRLIQHIERLKRMNETEFVDYICDTGSWIFKVKHFSKYGLGDSDDENDEEAGHTYKNSQSRVDHIRNEEGFRAQEQSSSVERSYEGDMSMDDSCGPDDTFAFRRSENTRLPGSFDTPIVRRPFAPNETYFTPVKFDDPTEAEEETYEETEGDPDYSMSVSDSESQTMNRTSDQSQLEESSTDHRELSSEPEFTDDDEEILSEEFESDERSLDRTISRFTHAASWPDQLQSFRQLPPALAKSPFLKQGSETATAITYGRYELNRDIFGEDEGESVAENHKAASRLSEDPNLTKEINAHRCLKPRWGNRFALVTLNPLYPISTTARSKQTEVTIQNIKCENEVIATALDVQLQHSIISNESGVPAAFPNDTLNFRIFSEIFNTEALTSIHEHRTWSLAQILFDDVVPNLPDDISQVTRSTVITSLRKESLSEWLQEGSRKRIDEELAQTAESGRRIFTHLTGNRIEEACLEASKSKDFRLGILLALAGSDDLVQEDLYNQIEDWRAKGIFSHISESHRLVYGLLSGNFLEFVMGSRDLEDFAPELAILKGLDWERAFALHLWYSDPDDGPIEWVTNIFAKNFRHHESDAKPRLLSSNEYHKNKDVVEKPWAWYLLSDSSLSANPWKTLDKIFDIKYHLLLLQANRRHTLEQVLLPRTCTSSPLDTRMSWHFYSILSHVKKVGDFSDREEIPDDLRAVDEQAMGTSVRANQLTLDYAWQLEGLGLWEWAIFILLHLETENTREQAIRDILGRNIETFINANDPQLLSLLTERMSIPKAWLLEAKALRARYLHLYWDEADNLIEAGAWKEAHHTVMNRIGPNAVIEMNLGDLKDLLEKFKMTDSIPEWNLGGQL